MKSMTEELYFSSDIIDGIKLDIIISSGGVKEILINRKSNSENLSAITQISPDDPKVVNVFKQLKEYFGRQRKEFDLPLEITRLRVSEKSLE